MKPWSEEEINYLYNNWGIVSVETISKNLGRSKDAIRVKRSKLGLERFLDSGDYITMHQLMQILGYSSSNTYSKVSWIEKRNFPIRYKKVGIKKYKVVKIEEFWKWAEKNQSFLDFSRFKSLSLGPEPNWAKEKRKRDLESKRQFKKNQKTPWTEREYEYLQFLVNQHKYTWSEISKMIGRTENAIERKLWELNISARPIGIGNTRWTIEQVNKLREMITQGYDYEHIINEFNGKSARAIKSKVFRLYGTQSLDYIRDNLRKEECDGKSM